MKLARAPKHEQTAPPTARDVFRAGVKLHDIAGKLELQDAIFVRHVANAMLSCDERAQRVRRQPGA